MRLLSTFGTKCLLCLLAVLLLLPGNLLASAEPMGTVMGEWGNITWTLKYETGLMTISGEGPGPDLPAVPNFWDFLPWYRYRDYIKTVVIEDGITDVRDIMFLNCPNLTTVHIGADAFAIAAGTFEDCKFIEEFVVSPENEHLSSVDGILFDKDHSRILRYPPAKAGPYVIPDTVVEVWGSAFNWCASLTSIEFPPSVTTIGPYAFASCRALTELYIPDTVTNVHIGAFSGCRSVRELYISRSLDKISAYAFSNLDSITHIDIPRNVTKIEAQGFGDCKSLTSVSMYRNVRNVHLPFAGSENLEHIYYVGSEADIYRLNIRAEYFFLLYDMHYGTSGTLPNGIAWELKSDDGALWLAGSGALTGEESVWEEFDEFYNGVYVPEGITGIQNCLDSQFKFCGTEIKDGVAYQIYGRPCTISFETSEGTGLPEPLTKQFGEDLILPNTIPTSDRYSFLGWGYYSSALEPAYRWGSTFEKNTDTVLHALWGFLSTVGIEMEKLPDKTVYQQGEALDMTGAVVRINYSDGSYYLEAEDFKVSGYDPSKPGRQKITVKCDSKKTSFYVTVLEKTPEPVLTGIRPIVTKTEYAVGEKFESSALSLELTFSDGSTQIITEGFTVDGFSSEAAGEVAVTVVYGDMSAQFQIVVSAKITGIRPIVTKTEYAVGEKFEPSTLSLEATFSDGSTQIITEGFTVDGFSSETTGEVTITVKYGEITDQFVVLVNELPSPPADDESQEENSADAESATDTELSQVESLPENSVVSSVSQETTSDGAPISSGSSFSAWWCVFASALAAGGGLLLILRRRRSRK